MRKDGFGRCGEGLSTVFATVTLRALSATPEPHDVPPLAVGAEAPLGKALLSNIVMKMNS